VYFCGNNYQWLKHLIEKWVTYWIGIFPIVTCTHQIF
jgi:hypothetical protein